MKQHVKGKLRGERIRDGVRVTIVGEPNVGKSSLLNILCKGMHCVLLSVFCMDVQCVLLNILCRGIQCMLLNVC